MNKPRNYYCHKNQSQFNGINSNYQIVQKIGEGAFGQVYKIFNPASSQLHVVKKSKVQDEKFCISKQNQIMKQMSQSQGFVKVKDFLFNSSNISNVQQKDNRNNYQKQKGNNAANLQKFVVMQCLGESFGTKIQQLKTFSVFTTKRIAYKLIQRLRQLHKKMYVHRDLKPDNILLGNQLHPHQIYLVDFGLVSKYRKNPNVVRNLYQGVIGTAKFCPLASHLGNQQFPIDDLQSLGYVLAYFLKGNLPWKCNQALLQNKKFQQIKQKKQSISTQQLSGGISCLKKYLKIIRSLKYCDQIPYQKLLQIFQTEAKQQFCFQFCKQKCLQKKKRQRSSLICEQKQNQANVTIQQIKFQVQPHACNLNQYKMME